MSARTIKATVDAYLSSDIYGPDDLNRSAVEAIHALSFYKVSKPPEDWTRVGTAEITVTLIDESAMVDAKVQSLRAEKAKVLGEAEARATQIEAKIQTLLAISYDGGEA